MSRASNARGLSNLAESAVGICGHLIGRVGRRLRRPFLLAVSGLVLLMLLIVILQSGLGVDNDVTITDSHRPEIVGGGE